MTSQLRSHTYQVWMQVFPLLMCGVFLGLLYVPLFIIPDKAWEAKVAVAAMCLGLLLMCSMLVWESLVWKMQVTDEGLLCTSPWRGTWLIGWDTIHRLEWSQTAWWFIIVTKKDAWFRFSFAITDRELLLAAFEKHLQPGQMAGVRAGYEFIRRRWPFAPAYQESHTNPVGQVLRGKVADIDLSRWGNRR